MSNLVKHAESELRKAKLNDKDSDYGGLLYDAVMALVLAHATQGHSGASHALTIEIFNKLVNFKTLTPLTSDPAEWTKVDPDQYQPGTWQSTRKSSCFSRDGGETWYDIDDEESVHTCSSCHTHFPVSHVGHSVNTGEWYCSESCLTRKAKSEELL